MKDFDDANFVDSATQFGECKQVFPLAEIFVPGIPKTKGSYRLVRSKYTGKAVALNACEGEKDWKNRVYSSALDKPPRDGVLEDVPLGLYIIFYLPKPKRIKKSGLVPHDKRPDLDKLIRSILDALTFVWFRDDGQISQIWAMKYYGKDPGVNISLFPVTK